MSNNTGLIPPAQPPVPADALTADQLRAALPEKMKKSVNQALIDKINQALSDPEFYETYRENLLSYTKVIQDGKFKAEQYIAAVKYVSYKLMGHTNREAYARTFPEKIQRFAMQGVADKDVASYITAYNKSKLVNLIFEQTMVPFWVLNQDLYQRALNTQAELMVNSNSDLVRSQAANSILTHLKPPEVAKVELDIGIKKDSAIDQLRQATLAMVEEQRKAIAAGVMNAQQVAHQRVIIEGEAERVD